MVYECKMICACIQPNFNETAAYSISTLSSNVQVNVTHNPAMCLLSDEIPVSDVWTTGSSMNVISAVFNRYLNPPVILITMITNIIICVVLARREMISPTNIILLAMALVDMFTGIFPLPWYISIGFARSQAVSQLCDSPFLANLRQIMFITIPTILHTISIWLTVILAIQRWIYIHFPLSVQRLCTNRISVTSITVLTFLVNLFMWIMFYKDGHYRTATALESGLSNIVVSCNEEGDKSTVIVLYILRGIFVSIVPTILLIVFTILLIKALAENSKRRKKLLSKQSSLKSPKNQKRNQEASNTTAMLTLVVGIFLLVELPMTCVTIVFCLSLLVGNHHYTLYVGYALPFINFVILVSYPCNFFIYSKMSTQFRQTFTRIFHLQSCFGQEEVSKCDEGARRKSQLPANEAKHVNVAEENGQHIALIECAADGEIN